MPITLSHLLVTTTKAINITNTSKPLRIALVWATQEADSQVTFFNNNILLYVYKENSSQAIARSYARGYPDPNSIESQEGPVTNYQYVEIPASTLAAKGAGNYTVKIIFTGTQSENIYARCSLAWAQK